MRPGFRRWVGRVHVAVALAGLALAVLPGPTALALGGVGAASAHHALAASPYDRVAPEIPRWADAALHPSAVGGTSRSAQAGYLAGLRRPYCLGGCPPIMRPFAAASSGHGAWSRASEDVRPER